MKHLRTFFSMLSVIYFTIYWALIIFIPYLSIKNTGSVAMDMAPYTVFIFMHPAMVGGMLVTLAISMLCLGKTCAIDDVAMAEQRALARIDGRAQELVTMVKLGRSILKDDTDVIVQKFIDRIKLEESFHESGQLKR